MQFDYLYETKAVGSIDIDDIGNVTLECINDIRYQVYYLMIRTEMGKTKIIEYGPMFLPELDSSVVPSSITCTYNEIDFNVNKISRIIEKFLNDPKRLVTQVREIDLEEAKSNTKDLIDLI